MLKFNKGQKSPKRVVANLLIVPILFTSTAVFAAIPKGAADAPVTSTTTEALSMPLNNRVQMIRQQGAAGYRNLVKLMQDASQTMEVRWRAVTAIGRVGGKDSRPELEKALGSHEWFMRNAGLIAMSNVDRDRAVVWARKLMSDKALMVRVAAVDALTALQDKASSELLWQKLYSAENFKGKQSLFIRRRIVESLASLETAGAESRFMRLLEDGDSTLHQPAMAGLERVTAKQMGGLKDSASVKRDRWLAWWKESKKAL